MRIILIAVLLMAFTSTTHAGTIDLLYSGSAANGIRSYKLGGGFAHTLSDEITVSGDYHKGKTSGIVTQDKGDISLHFNPPINERWSLWLDERVGYDKMFGIDFENYLGAGLKYYLYKKGKTKFSLSSGILYQYTPDKDHGRYSHRAKFGNGILSLVYFYQPNIEDDSDYITKFAGDLKLAEVGDGVFILLHHKSEYRSLFGRSDNSGIKLRVEY